MMSHNLHDLSPSTTLRLYSVYDVHYIDTSTGTTVCIAYHSESKGINIKFWTLLCLNSIKKCRGVMFLMAKMIFFLIL